MIGSIAGRLLGVVMPILVLAGLATPAWAEVLTFEDIALDTDGFANIFGSYQAPGSDFVLAGDFQARGPGAASADFTPETQEGSGVITTSLAPFGPGTVTLTNANGIPFTLESIDLAREFRFNDPSAGVSFPVVTFEGTQVDGSLVSQTFVADQAGFFFRTFEFSGDFVNLVSVTWQQPAFGVDDPDNPGQILGLHQFDNIVVTPIPEPASLALVGFGAAVLVALGRSRRRTIVAD